METDSFGNRGYYRKTSDNSICDPIISDNGNKSYPNDCYFSVDIRARAGQSSLGGMVIKRDDNLINQYEQRASRGACFKIEEGTDPVYQQYMTQSECSAPTYKWEANYFRTSQDQGLFDESTLTEQLEKINNGRVSDVSISSNVMKKKKDLSIQTNNQEISVKGIIEETALSKYFFSNENIESIQKTLRYRVYKNTDKVIDKQSEKELFIVMRSILLQYGNFKVSSNDLLSEILKLNERVVTYCVDEVTSNVLQYIGYLEDLKKLPIPLDRPSFNDSGSRNRTYDLSNHIAPHSDGGWQSRHRNLHNSI